MRQVYARITRAPRGRALRGFFRGGKTDTEGAQGQPRLPVSSLPRPPLPWPGRGLIVDNTHSFPCAPPAGIFPGETPRIVYCATAAVCGAWCCVMRTPTGAGAVPRRRRGLGTRTRRQALYAPVGALAVWGCPPQGGGACSSGMGSPRHPDDVGWGLLMPWRQASPLPTSPRATRRSSPLRGAAPHARGDGPVRLMAMTQAAPVHHWTGAAACSRFSSVPLSVRRTDRRPCSVLRDVGGQRHGHGHALVDDLGLSAQLDCVGAHH